MCKVFFSGILGLFCYIVLGEKQSGLYYGVTFYLKASYQSFSKQKLSENTQTDILFNLYLPRLININTQSILEDPGVVSWFGRTGATNPEPPDSP